MPCMCGSWNKTNSCIRYIYVSQIYCNKKTKKEIPIYFITVRDKTLKVIKNFSLHKMKMMRHWFVPTNYTLTTVLRDDTQDLMDDLDYILMTWVWIYTYEIHINYSITRWYSGFNGWLRLHTDDVGLDFSQVKERPHRLFVDTRGPSLSPIRIHKHQ